MQISQEDYAELRADFYNFVSDVYESTVPKERRSQQNYTPDDWACSFITAGVVRGIMKEWLWQWVDKWMEENND